MKNTKDLILDAALELFARNSYHTVSMRDIANAVGIKPASIYNHYPSKDALLETIYQFFDSNMKRLLPDLGELMAQIGRVHPHTILKATNFQYPREIMDPMAKAMLIASSLIRSDPRADVLVQENLIDAASRYDPPLLARMMELDLIEPIHIGSYTLVHSSFCHSTAIRFYHDRMVDGDTWQAGLEMICSMVRVR